MPTPVKPGIIGVRAATLSNLNDGEYVKVTNYTSGGTISGAVKGGAVYLDPRDSNLTWNVDDTIIAEINGRVLKSASTTIKKEGTQITLTVGSTDDDSPQVNL